MDRRFLTGLVAALCLAAGIPAAASAADAYPTRPIRAIIAYTPGGPTDAVGRVVLKALGDKLGQAIIIENHPGGGGNIGSEYVARQQPDGYVFLYGTSSISISPTLMKKADLEASKVFRSAGCAASVPLILMTSPNVNAKSAKDLIDQMKANPNKFFQGSSGLGQIDHLVGAMVGKTLGLTFVHVPYKGNASALTDLVAGHIQFMYGGSFASALPFIKEGRIHALAVTSKTRSPALLDVPTVDETIIKGFSASTWQALEFPKDTPQSVITLVNEKLNEVLAMPEIQKQLILQGATTMPGTPAQCDAFVNAETARWSDIITQYNITSE
jgi:tripartite-type tricarboxylate transporter receptor subunit TctC